MMIGSPRLPKRIVALTEETTETLYLLGAEDLLAGITQFTVRPPRAKKEKPVVARFTDAKIDKIISLKPDLVVAWSDLQADIAAALIREGIEVMCFNHRNIQGIFDTIYKLGLLAGKGKEAVKLADSLKRNLEKIYKRTSAYRERPVIYFEEWYDPLISGICWVSEIIEICGGDDIFSHHREFQDAKRRILPDDSYIKERNPDIIFASWCGKKFRPESMKEREGWNKIEAVKNNDVYEIGSDIILQPGPAALTDGISEIDRIITKWQSSR